jgi:hypothetical protein
MRRTATLLAVGLLLAAFSLVGYRIIGLGYPVLPATPAKAWGVSLEARVPPDQNNARVKIAIPYSHEDQLVVEERIASGPLNVSLVQEGANQVGIWSGNTGAEGAVIRYTATILLQPRRTIKITPPKLDAYPAEVTAAEQALAARFVERWTRLTPPARLRAIAAEIASAAGKARIDNPELPAGPLLEKTHGQVKAVLTLLRAAGLPARVAEGFFLAESVMAAPIRWIEVWTGQEWDRLQPETGHIYPASVSFLVLTLGGAAPVRISVPETLETRWALSKQIISQWRIQFERVQRSARLLDRWSLFSLPPQFQETFRILLLVPIGALMICVLRNIIGFPTFGIFMPVLMALAFRNTGLAYGLCIFGGVLLLGYAVRRWLDRLRLLLVPRLSVMVTLVICCFTLFALAGSKLGLRELMAVGLLPFVILTMTIERFFITVEESGGREALKMALGSAAVAAITHEIIHFEGLQLTFFVYPELLLAVAAFQIVVGRYTGYRLSEYLRFRTFRRPS